MTEGSAWRLAIDFGTTATVGAVSTPSTGSYLLNFGPTSRMPSSVFLERTGALAVGSRAVSQAMTGPDRFNPTPKREMGRPDIVLGGQRIPTEQVVAAVLLKVLQEAFRQHGHQPPDSVRLTHPVAWGPLKIEQLLAAYKRAATMLPEALEKADQAAAVRAAANRLPEPTLVPEPVAAAWFHAARSRVEQGQRLAIYDLGGGTFDTAVLERDAQQNYRILDSGGLGDLGGEDFDRALFRMLGEKRIAPEYPEEWERILRPRDQPSRHNARRLQERTKQAKEELSEDVSTNVVLLENPLYEVGLKRQDLDELIAPRIHESLDSLEQTLNQAGVSFPSLAALYLVGGSARIPLVGRLLESRFGVRVEARDDPKALVALGALLYDAGPKQISATPPTPEPTGGLRTAVDIAASGPTWAGPSGKSATKTPQQVALTALSCAGLTQDPVSGVVLGALGNMLTRTSDLSVESDPLAPEPEPVPPSRPPLSRNIYTNRLIVREPWSAQQVMLYQPGEWSITGAHVTESIDFTTWVQQRLAAEEGFEKPAARLGRTSLDELTVSGVRGTVTYHGWGGLMAFVPLSPTLRVQVWLNPEFQSTYIPDFLTQLRVSSLASDKSKGIGIRLPNDFVKPSEVSEFAVAQRHDPKAGLVWATCRAVPMDPKADVPTLVNWFLDAYPPFPNVKAGHKIKAGLGAPVPSSRSTGHAVWAQPPNGPKEYWRAGISGDHAFLVATPTAVKKCEAFSYAQT